MQDEAQLETWDAQSLHDKVAGFRVVAQGCTPHSQTIPRAELAAVVWATRWLAQLPHVEAVMFTDAQYVLDQWQTLRTAPEAVDALANRDLAAGLPSNPLIELRKVKAHNPDGLKPEASAYLKWTTMGNEVADAAARQARQGELGQASFLFKISC